MTRKLQKLFLLSIPLFIVHGVEEILTGFYNIDSHAAFLFGGLAKLPNMQALFVLFQIMLWLVLVISYLLLLGPKWQLRLMFVPGLIFIYELHHLYKAIEVGGYYSGLITALAFPAIGFFFWKELLQSYKTLSLREG